jgi:hypothetical protein
MTFEEWSPFFPQAATIDDGELSFNVIEDNRIQLMFRRQGGVNSFLFFGCLCTIPGTLVLFSLLFVEPFWAKAAGTLLSLLALVAVTCRLSYMVYVEKQSIVLEIQGWHGGFGTGCTKVRLPMDCRFRVRRDTFNKAKRFSFVLTNGSSEFSQLSGLASQIIFAVSKDDFCHEVVEQLNCELEKLIKRTTRG